MAEFAGLLAATSKHVCCHRTYAELAMELPREMVKSRILETKTFDLFFLGMTTVPYILTERVGRCTVFLPDEGPSQPALLSEEVDVLGPRVDNRRRWIML